jgi:hypothetical protein
LTTRLIKDDSKIVEKNKEIKRLVGVVEQARQLTHKAEDDYWTHHNFDFLHFLKELLGVLGEGGSGGSVEATVATGAKSSEVKPTLVDISLRENQSSRGTVREPAQNACYSEDSDGDAHYFPLELPEEKRMPDGRTGDY